MDILTVLEARTNNVWPASDAYGQLVSAYSDTGYTMSYLSPRYQHHQWYIPYMSVPAIKLCRHNHQHSSTDTEYLQRLARFGYENKTTRTKARSMR